MKARRWSQVTVLLVIGAACASSPPPPAAGAAAATGVPDTGPTTKPAPAPTAAPASAPPLAQRSASGILGDAIQTMGSPDAWNVHKSLRMSMTMSFQGVGITGTAQRFATATDKSVTVTDIPGVGIIREGCNGKLCWSQDPINGLRMLEGAEAEQSRIESVWNPELRVNELFAKVEAKNQAGPDGKMLECVVVTPKIAPPSTRCYDPVTHLQVSEVGVRPTPQGDTPFSSTVSDWRTVGGLKMPFALETQAGPITFAAKVQSVVYDEPMDDKQFEPPQPTPAAPADAAGKSTKTKSKDKAKKAKTPAGREPAKAN
ncbi:MAG TPA: hypothetical protein VGL59_25820 [Polyangia bacterium]|jgi:hypothetical protein